MEAIRIVNQDALTDHLTPAPRMNTCRSFMRSRTVRTIGLYAGLCTTLCITLFAGFFYNLDSVPLFDVDEGAFAEATREMRVSGDYITTFLNGVPRFDKPVLIYWLQAVSVALLGINEFAFRLPSALAATGWIAALLVFTIQHVDRATGFAAAFIAASTLGICVIGRVATADALLNLFLVLALFDIYRYMESPNRMCRYRAYLWIGLGVLTKGPIAILIPFAVSGIAFSLQGKWTSWARAVFDPVGWLVLAAVAGPWYFREYQVQGLAFIDGFFMRHNLQRFQGPLQGHSGNAFYYLPMVLVLLLPYSGLFVRILPTIRSMRDDRLSCFAWSWFLFVLVFFSIAGTKLPHYLLYGISPLMILMAIHRESLQSRSLALAGPFFLLLATLALPSLLMLAGLRTDQHYLREMLLRDDVFGPSYYLIAGALLAVMGVLVIWPRMPCWQRLIATGPLCSIALGALLLPALAEIQQGPVKEAAAIARKTGEPVTAWGINMPSFSVYLGDITRRPGVLNHGLIFTRVDALSTLSHGEILYRKGGIALVRFP